jgi:hypothetical protein
LKLPLKGHDCVTCTKKHPLTMFNVVNEIALVLFTSQRSPWCKVHEKQSCVQTICTSCPRGQCNTIPNDGCIIIDSLHKQLMHMSTIEEVQHEVGWVFIELIMCWTKSNIRHYNCSTYPTSFLRIQPCLAITFTIPTRLGCSWSF